MGINAYKRNQIDFFYFFLLLSIAPLMKAIRLKCIGHGCCYKGISKRRLRPVHGLSVSTSCNFFPIEHPFIWKGYARQLTFQGKNK